MVPDLSPVNQNLSNSPYENISDQFQQLRLTTNAKTNIQHRRRMLPTIPVGKRRKQFDDCISFHFNLISLLTNSIRKTLAKRNESFERSDRTIIIK